MKLCPFCGNAPVPSGPDDHVECDTATCPIADRAMRTKEWNTRAALQADPVVTAHWKDGKLLHVLDCSPMPDGTHRLYTAPPTDALPANRAAVEDAAIGRAVKQQAGFRLAMQQHNRTVAPKQIHNDPTLTVLQQLIAQGRVATNKPTDEAP